MQNTLNCLASRQRIPFSALHDSQRFFTIKLSNVKIF